MKVCVTFHNDIFTPWPATSIIHPIETLLEAGHEVTVLSWDKGRGEKINEAILPVKRERIHVPISGNKSLYEFSNRLSQKIIEEKPNLVPAFDLDVLKGSADGADSLDVPLLFFAREDWPAMVKRGGDLKSLARAKVFARLEKKICRTSV